MAVNNANENIADVTREDLALLDQCSRTYMIGRLRSYNAVRYVNTGSIQFYVEPLCADPAPVLSLAPLAETGDHYIGFDNNQDEEVLPWGYDAVSFDDDRESRLEDYLSGKLMVFQPAYVYSKNNSRWYKNLYITSLIDDRPDMYHFFEMVPRAVYEQARFERMLRKGEFFELRGYNSQLAIAPEMIICGSFAYRLKDLPGGSFLEADPANPEMWHCVDFEHTVKVDLTAFADHKALIIRGSSSVVFMESNFFNQVRLADRFAVMEAEKGRIRTLEQITDRAELYSEADITASREYHFLEALKKLTMDQCLQYQDRDLYNFHISLKTNPLTILAGMAGTGKSRLAMSYARMLGASEEDGTLLFMPVTPSYTEPSDVLGFLNTMNDRFMPAETGLAGFLVHAENNPDKMHMVIFDEMNLAQVEYWFSPFISILEKERGERILRLYDKDASCVNSEQYPASVSIGENVLFVGTVNVDDTTKDFSDRLLDRTFVIPLGMVSFEDFYDAYVTHTSAKEDADVDRAMCRSAGEYRTWCHGDDLHYLEAFKDSRNELAFFDDLTSLLKSVLPAAGISYRVLKNIGNYILNVPMGIDGPLIERKEVLDLIINQTVMTKIRGTETQLSSLLGSNGREAQLTELLDRYRQISDFTETRRTLAARAEELRINGYTD